MARWSSSARWRTDESAQDVVPCLALERCATVWTNDTATPLGSNHSRSYREYGKHHPDDGKSRLKSSPSRPSIPNDTAVGPYDDSNGRY
jgi:hypothetical protein